MITHEVISTAQKIFLGRQGENNARQILFKPSYFRAGGTGEFVLLHQRQGDSAPYPVAITQDGEYVVWTVTSADTANAGSGKCELQYLEDDVVIKSRTWTTETLKALEEAGETPDPESGWVAQMMAEIDEKLSAQGVDAAEVNELIAAYLVENPVTVETPTYDFTDLGEINVTSGSKLEIECEYDTENLISDIEKGAINVKVNITYNTTTSTYVFPLTFYKRYDDDQCIYYGIDYIYIIDYGFAVLFVGVVENYLLIDAC